MKIALVSPYDFVHPGGVVNHILALYDQLAGMGHEVKIIAPASHAVGSDERFLHIGRALPFPVRGTTIRISMSLRLASRIKEVLAREKFDIIHLHEPFMPMLCSAVLRFSDDAVNIGTFHACHGSPGYNFGWPISRIMLQKRRRKLLGKIAVSRVAKEYAQKHVPGEYSIIPNGIDLGHFNPEVPPIKRFRDDKLNILFVGRLEKRKGFDHLLKAYSQVKKEIPRCRLIVVGPGIRFRHKYEKYVRNHNIPDVVFAGMVSYDELPRYYQTADIFCSPATGRESFGIVLLEAMALGKPVVATNIEGYASVMTSGKEGLLVTPKDDQELARALKILITDEPLRRRMGERGLTTARQHDWSKVARRVADYYVEMLNQSPLQQHSLEYEVASASI